MEKIFWEKPLKKFSFERRKSWIEKTTSFRVQIEMNFVNKTASSNINLKQKKTRKIPFFPATNVQHVLRRRETPEKKNPFIAWGLRNVGHLQDDAFVVSRVQLLKDHFLLQKKELYYV